MSHTEITLTGGEHLVVDGEPSEIEAAILSASRGSLMDFAWLTESHTGRPVGINPDQVLLLRGRGAGAPSG